MAWYQEKGREGDVVISSRIRLARNLAGYPFGNRLTEAGAKEIISRIDAALSGKNFACTKMEEIPAELAASLVEQHYISREFAAASGPRALFQNENKSLSLMACEEDHIRLQCILPGLSLTDAYRLATEADDLLDSALPLAFDEKLGYLTHCPTNLGTGLRASVMLFLPALEAGGYMPSLSHQLAKRGFTVRGLYGEGTAPRAALYQISNQITLGTREEDILSRLEETVLDIIKKERELRTAPKGEAALAREDRICRAEGTLRFATRISSAEFFSLYADIKLGIALGIINSITEETLNTLLISVLPATLSRHATEQFKTSAERDAFRAKFIKQALEVKKA